MTFELHNVEFVEAGHWTIIVICRIPIVTHENITEQVT